MHEALGMGGDESLGEGVSDTRGLPPPERPHPQPAAQGLPVEQFHDRHRMAVEEGELVDAEHVGCERAATERASDSKRSRIAGSEAM